jgi:hypothetical protein
MREQVTRFLVQSRNTCDRPVVFTGPETGQVTAMHKLAEDKEPPKEKINADQRVSGNESDLIEPNVMPSRPPSRPASLLRFNVPSAASNQIGNCLRARLPARRLFRSPEIGRTGITRRRAAQ